MAQFDSVTSGIADVSSALDEIATEATKIANQLASGMVTQAQIDEAAASLRSLADRARGQARDVDALVETEGEDDVVEPEPVPEP